MGGRTVQAALESISLIAGELDLDAPTHAVVFALGGLFLGNEETRFGNVRLFTMTGAEIATFRSRFESILASTPHAADERTQMLAQLDELLVSLQDAACAEVSVEGDVERAKAEAVQFSEPVIDFLQLIVAIWEHSSKRIRIIVGGDTLAQQPLRLVLAADGSAAYYDQKIAHNFRLELTGEHIDQMRNKGFGPMIDAIGKHAPDRSDFERLLLASLHWLADAERQELPENKVTSYVTALEMFFSSPRGEPITRDVSEGIALLLADSLEQRQQIRDRVKHLYGIRSGVSHRGQRAADDGTVLELKKLAINVLAKMSRLSWRFTSKDSIVTWIADLRLSATYSIEPMAQTEPD